jgi:hypothetical protein
MKIPYLPKRIHNRYAGRADLKKMIAFAVPLMFSSILQLLFNAADIVVVGRFAGDLSLAAVGSTSSLVNLLTNLFVGLSVGANVLAARDRGAKDDEALSRTVHTAMLLSLISGIVLTVAGIVCARSMLTWMQTPAEVLDLAVLYLRIYFTGMTATMIYNFGSAVLRSVGDTKRPLYFLFFAGVINVILNLFFVIVLKMDVAGVATATAISQCISAFLVVGCLVKRRQRHPPEAGQAQDTQRQTRRDFENRPPGRNTGRFVFAFKRHYPIFREHVRRNHRRRKFSRVKHRRLHLCLDERLLPGDNFLYKPEHGGETIQKNRADPDARAALRRRRRPCVRQRRRAVRPQPARHLHIERRCR